MATTNIDCELTEAKRNELLDDQLDLVTGGSQIGDIIDTITSVAINAAIDDGGPPAPTLTLLHPALHAGR
jgi:hypothetical protein